MSSLDLDLRSAPLVDPVPAATVIDAVPVATAATERLEARQTASAVLMVSPLHFRRNPDTAADNTFMHESGLSDDEIPRRALQEFERFVAALRRLGVEVQVVPGDDAEAPDAVFPNNWFTTHRDAHTSALALYPMATESRRRERQPRLIDQLRPRYQALVDLTHYESDPEPVFLEGTGVLVLDRVHRVAYVALSKRADERVARAWAERFQYELVAFHTELDGVPIYHTNVMMSVGTRMAVVCLEAVPDATEREHLRAALARYHTLVEISAAQMGEFCGNVLEVQSAPASSSNADDSDAATTKTILVMSETAHRSFTEAQRAVLAAHVDHLLAVDIPVIERIGGGGVRCMMAELF